MLTVGGIISARQGGASRNQRGEEKKARGKVENMRNRRPQAARLVVWLALLLVPDARLAGQLPPSKGAPSVGEKAPDFTLPDSTGKPVKLSELLASSGWRQGAIAAPSRAPWVLLIFYRGYW